VLNNAHVSARWAIQAVATTKPSTTETPDSSAPSTQKRSLFGAMWGLLDDIADNISGATEFAAGGTASESSISQPATDSKQKED